MWWCRYRFGSPVATFVVTGDVSEGRSMAAHSGMIAGLVLLVALSGCRGGDSEAAPSPSPTPTVSGGTSPSPTPQPETAEQFIRRWVEVYNEMQNTGDTEEFRLLGPKCPPCRRLAAGVGRYYADGGYVKTEGWRTLKTKEKVSVKDKMQFDVEIDASPIRYRESADGPVKSLDGGRTTIRFDLLQRDDSWQVADFTQVAQ
jgi:hypothetical protein